jgi:hypothetical protein
MPNRAGVHDPTDSPVALAARPRGEPPARRAGVGVVKSPRARGGCLGVIGNAGVEGCEMSGGAAQRASIPECPHKTRAQSSKPKDHLPHVFSNRQQ